MDSFSKTYIEARSKFIAAASDAGACMHAYGREDLCGKDGEPLSCDVAILGDEVAQSAAIVIAGSCGSAVQHRWLSLCTEKSPSAEAARYDPGEYRTHAVAGWANRVPRCKKRT